MQIQKLKNKFHQILNAWKRRNPTADATTTTSKPKPLNPSQSAKLRQAGQISKAQHGQMQRFWFEWLQGRNRENSAKIKAKNDTRRREKGLPTKDELNEQKKLTQSTQGLMMGLEKMDLSDLPTISAVPSTNPGETSSNKTSISKVQKGKRKGKGISKSEKKARAALRLEKTKRKAELKRLNAPKPKKTRPRRSKAEIARQNAAQAEGKQLEEQRSNGQLFLEWKPEGQAQTGGEAASNNPEHLLMEMARQPPEIIKERLRSEGRRGEGATQRPPGAEVVVEQGGDPMEVEELDDIS